MLYIPYMYFTSCTCILLPVRLSLSFVASMSEADLSNSVKNGILYMEDPVDHEWLPHFFVLTQTKLLYTEETSAPQDEEEEEDCTTTPPSGDVSN